MPKLSTFVENLNRKKFVSFDSSPLSRTLTLIDLTALGIGSTVGVGFYILAGQVARETAGPAVTISFLIAAIASVFAGLCYAEFGARVPKAGSAYVYSYVCVGEFVAFVIGWNLLLEYVIGTASVARGYSSYVDDLANHSISRAFNNAMHMEVIALADYPDFFACGVTLLLTAILVIGVKESTRANNIFTAINIFVIAYVIIAGGTQGDVYNWHLSQEDVDNRSICYEPRSDEEGHEYDWGTGGFAPYGFEGIMQGAATCFFGFVGFDVIATTAEEAIRPERNIPISICISLLCIFLAYFGMSTVLTLALPYCLMDPDAPLIELFDDKGMMVSKWIVSVGAIFGFSASLLGAMFPMPRILYAMADDGLIFRFLARIDKRFKTPAIATILAGILAAIMALLFSLDALVDMMSIGTLMAYTIVSVCVMLLRYAPDNETDFVTMSKNAAANIETKFDAIKYAWKDYIKQLFNVGGLTEPTQLSSSLVNYATLVFSCVCFLLALFISMYGRRVLAGDPGIIVLICVVLVLTVTLVVVISIQPRSRKKLTFQVPFVPWVPALSTFINLYLMCNLSTATWIRFIFWMIIGFAIYFLYGIWHSSGSEIPKAKLTGKDNEGMEISIINKNIPPIIVQPPTPWGSRLGTPTNTIPNTPPERASIIESSVVLGSTVAINSSMQKEDAVVTVDETDYKKGATSQSIDVSPVKLEEIDHPSDSESEDGGDKIENISKLESTQVFVAATVYSNDSKDHNKILSKDKYLAQATPQQENFQAVIFNGDTDTSTWDSGIDLNNSRGNVSPFNSGSSESSVSDKITFDKQVKEIEIATSGVDDKTEAYPILISNSEGHNEVEKILQDENQVKETTKKKHPLRTAKSVPLFELEGHVHPSIVSVMDDPVTCSEPGTPKRNRPHPIKVLSRASSFDYIPPSSPDSPFAKKVKNFIIIPVSVPDKTEDHGSESSLISDGHIAPSSSMSNTPQISLPSYHSDKASVNMMSNLNSKLKHLENSDQNVEVSGMGKDDETNPSTVFMFPPLDPIRERGESKVSQTDITVVTKTIESSTVGT